MKKLFRVISLCLVVIFLMASFFSPKNIFAAQCGMNIDPINPKGRPARESLSPGTWVRIEYKDCNPDDPTVSLEFYRGVLEYYSATHPVLLIIDYMSHPQARNDFAALAETAALIDKELGGMVGAYEIWNEPDLPNVGGLSPDQFREMANTVIPSLSSGKPIILAGFASGDLSYASRAVQGVSGYTAVSVHPYGHSVNYGGESIGFIHGEMETIIRGYEDATNSSVWITEIGTEDNAIAGSYIKGVYTQMSRLPNIFWFAWSDAMGAANHNFGITKGGQPKPGAFNAYSSMCGVPSTGVSSAPITVPESFDSNHCATGTGDPWETEGGGGKEIDDYYVYPIEGVNEKDKDRMKMDLMKQGYEVMCMPFIPVKITVNAITNYLYAKVPAGSAYVETVASQVADFSGSQVPIWRTEDAISLDDMVSLESFWGYRNIPVNSESGETVDEATIYRLLTPKQQCEKQVKILKTVRVMCSKLQNPATCALDMKIKDTDYTHSSLLGAFLGSGLSCEDIGDGLGDESLRKGLANTPLYLSEAYRLAFLILSAEVKEPKQPLGGFPFNFLRATGPANSYEPKHDVRVLVFKLPDIGMNRDNDSDIYYEDVLQLTRNAYLTPEAQESIASAYQEHKFRTQTTDEITCVPGSDYCDNNMLVQGLVEYVNDKIAVSSEDVCDKFPSAFPTDEVDALFTPGVLDEVQGTKHIWSSAGDIVKSLKDEFIGQKAPFGDSGGEIVVTEEERTTDGEGADEGRGGADSSTVISSAGLPFSFISQADANPPGQGETKIKGYLIFPQGYQLKTVEKTLAGIIYDPKEKQEFFEAFEGQGDSEHKRFFKIKETGMALETDITKDISVTHWQVPKCFVTDQGTLSCPTETIANNVVGMEEDKEPRIHGGILGKLMRNIQLSLREVTSESWQYIKSCPSTEAFLLGNCGDVNTN